MKIANFMDSSIADLKKKGVFSSVGDIYNPDNRYELVVHFTPHTRDLEFAHSLKANKIEMVCHHAAAMNPVRLFGAFLIVLINLKKYRVDLVRGRLPYLGSLIGGVCAKTLGVPFVVSLGGDNRIAQERNSSYYYNNRFVSYHMEALVLKMADAVIVPNYYTHNYVATIIGPNAADKKCAKIPWISAPIPETDPDEPSIDHLVDERMAVVPIIGFLNEYKFSDVLFKALDGVSDIRFKGNPVQFIFCGDGPLRSKGERLFRGKKTVRLIGWQQRPVVQALLRRAAFVIIPMSGFVLLEAASIGKPVITSAVEWHREMVENERTGLIVNPRRPIAWRSAIIQIATDPNHAEQMGLALKTRYDTDYSMQASIRAEVSLYKHLSKGKGKK